MLQIREGLENLKPYNVEDTVYPIKLDANEMPETFAGQIKQLIADKLLQISFNRYPQVAATSLRNAVAEELGLTKDNVLIGNGSSELLEALCYTFGGKGRRILFPVPSFSMYGVYTALSDSEPVPFPLAADFSVPAQEMVKSIHEKSPSLVILCNPNNPTGNVMPQSDIEYIAANAKCPVVVDEAYYEFYGKSSLDLLGSYPNLIITRTFSKAYGLAAARIGYLAASVAAAGAVGKVLLPYHINALSLTVAETVFSNRKELMPAVYEVISERRRLADLFAGIGDLQVFPSETNFLLIKTDRAGELSTNLSTRGISIRDFSKYPGLNNCIRITIGTKTENDKAADAVSAFFKRG